METTPVIVRICRLLKHLDNALWALYIQQHKQKSYWLKQPGGSFDLMISWDQTKFSISPTRTPFFIFAFHAKILNCKTLMKLGWNCVPPRGQFRNSLATIYPTFSRHITSKVVFVDSELISMFYDCSIWKEQNNFKFDSNQLLMMRMFPV